jgi:hypothetical protein
MVDVRNAGLRTHRADATPDGIAVDHNPQAQVDHAPAERPAIERDGLFAAPDGMGQGLTTQPSGIGQLANIGGKVLLPQGGLQQEVVQDVVVENRDAGVAKQHIVDGTMEETVSHVVEDDVVGPPLLGEPRIVQDGEAVSKRSGDGSRIRHVERHLGQLREIGNQLRAVIGDPRPLRGERAEVGDTQQDSPRRWMRGLVGPGHLEGLETAL